MNPTVIRYFKVFVFLLSVSQVSVTHFFGCAFSHAVAVRCGTNCTNINNVECGCGKTWHEQRGCASFLPLLSSDPSRAQRYTLLDKVSRIQQNAHNDSVLKKTRSWLKLVHEWKRLDNSLDNLNNFFNVG